MKYNINITPMSILDLKIYTYKMNTTDNTSMFVKAKNCVYNDGFFEVDKS